MQKIFHIVEKKQGKEAINLMCSEMAKTKHFPRTRQGDHDIEILDTRPFDGGIEVLIRAWHKDGGQLGFGKDKDVDIERVRIFDPGILVPDPNGDILIDTSKDPITGVITEHRYREDHHAALLLNLEVAVRNKKPSDLIVPGKVGNTTAVLNATADCRIVNGSGSVPDTNYGGAGETILYAGDTDADGTSSPNVRPMVKFDIQAGISAGSTINSATLSLYEEGYNRSSSQNVTITIHRILRNWGETTATWNKYDGTNSWTTAGAGSSGNDIAASNSGTNNVGATPAVGFKDWTSAQLATDVQNMLDGSNNQYGWRFISDFEAQGTGYAHDNFRSKKNASTSDRPKLTIDYTSPTLSVSVSDQLNITESVTMLRISFVNTSDQLNITESVTLVRISNISVFDNITITETLTMQGGNSINVFDSITITESVTMFLPILIVNVSDQLNITENVSRTFSDRVKGLSIMRGQDQSLPVTMTAQEYPLGFKDDAQS